MKAKVDTIKKDIGILTDGSYELNCGKRAPMKKTEMTLKKEIKETSVWTWLASWFFSSVFIMKFYKFIVSQFSLCFAEEEI